MRYPTPSLFAFALAAAAAAQQPLSEGLLVERPAWQAEFTSEHAELRLPSASVGTPAAR